VKGPVPDNCGPARFARFAYPPNILGYCGTDDGDGLWGYASAQMRPDRGLRELAETFEGAWPYLTLLAGAAGTDDPLADAVVEAYWLGGPLLDRVDSADWGWHVRDRFGPRLGGEGRRAVEGASAGGRPTHAFHVLCVYPWVGLLRTGLVDGPLHVLDRCRIRWGTVQHVGGGRAVVESRPLAWQDGRLTLGRPIIETASLAVDGRGLITGVRPGDTVALHWDWVCERLDPVTLRALVTETHHHLSVANANGVTTLA
jgi:hypothetical protein